MLRARAATSARGTGRTTLPPYRIRSYKRDGRSAVKKRRFVFSLSVMNGYNQFIYSTETQTGNPRLCLFPVVLLCLWEQCLSVTKVWNVIKQKLQSCHTHALKLQTSYSLGAHHLQLCANKHWSLPCAGNTY